MPSSTYTIHPALRDNNRKDKAWSAAGDSTVECIHPTSEPHTAASFAVNGLPPYSHIPSNSASPSLNNVSTPADSLSAYSEYCYQSSDFSDLVDPFFGVDFEHDGSPPSFLDDQALSVREESSDISEASDSQAVSSRPEQYASGVHGRCLKTKSKLASVQPTLPSDEHKGLLPVSQSLPESDSQPYPQPSTSITLDPNLSQPTALSGCDKSTTRSSEGSMASRTAPGPSPSPRVTVSMWDHDYADQLHTDGAFSDDMLSPTTKRATGMKAGDTSFAALYQRPSEEKSQPGPAIGQQTGRQGWGPESRSVAEGTSINELHSQRQLQKRNEEVDQWLTTSEDMISPDEPSPRPASLLQEGNGHSLKDVSLGDLTENRPLPGQTYYTEQGGQITDEDVKLMRQHRVWSDAPVAFRITDPESERDQPQSSAAAMERFQQMCQDTGSVLSRSATWGTRRRSLPSIADMDGITSGSFLKKLSISGDRKPSILFKELRGLVRRPSASHLLKRHRSVPEEGGADDVEAQDRGEDRNTLAPPHRSGSWGRNKQIPSINTALVSMATGAAAIGTSHARTSSISYTATPKSPFNLQVNNAGIKRPRSRSELPKGSSHESHPNLIEMWKKSGGPPVPQLAKGPSAQDPDDEDDEDEDVYEEGDVRSVPTNFIEDITPNFAGFKKQVLRMNPKLADQNTYLVDRIAHQQIVRYKALLNNRVKHLQSISCRSCLSGRMCIDQGGSAVPFDMKGETRGMDPLSTNYDGSDGDSAPLEGAVTAESFPSGIPMPPTNSLPAEFECQLCYQVKKFTKPSDWTKHVHEDVQPFTCTWDRCREPKIFKRKADWVRHENEGHRHLEWWTCDIEDCRHTCYRRDNFLQHLVREHKFQEPKVKTKAAIKRSGALDPTWQKVEKCHAETPVRPQDEPCRFCGKMLPTWKKLTVHLAKHMESMSLPILRLVALKELEVDTIISPVQDPPPRTFPPVDSETQAFGFAPTPIPSPGIQQQPGVLGYPNTQHHSYTYQNPSSFPNAYYDSSMHGIQQNGAINLGIHTPGIGAGFQSQTDYQNLPASTGSFIAPPQYGSITQAVEPFPAFMDQLGLQDPSGNQIYNTLGLNPADSGGGQYHHQSSASPYSQSPLEGQDGFFHHQR